MMALDALRSQREGRFLGLPLDLPTTAEFLDGLSAHHRAGGGAGPRIAYLNAHTTNLAFSDAAYRNALRRCTMVYADGMAVVWAARRLGLQAPERVNAADFIGDVARRAAAEGWRVALVGGAPGEAESAARRLGEEAPGFDPVYIHDGYYGEDEEDAVAAGLTAARPTLVLLGMGSPRQEVAMLRFASTPGLEGCAFWCVGALFEYCAGTRWRAPVWMRRAGLEWLVRLALEPGRLWRRYLVGNAAFVARVLLRRKAPTDNEA